MKIAHKDIFLMKKVMES